MAKKKSGGVNAKGKFKVSTKANAKSGKGGRTFGKLVLGGGG